MSEACISTSESINQDEMAFESLTELTPEIRFRDALIMGTRLVRGLDLELLGKRYNINAEGFVRDTYGRPL